MRIRQFYASGRGFVLFVKHRYRMLCNITVVKRSKTCYNLFVICANARKGRTFMKRIISVVLVILMIVALVGCGSKQRKPIKLTLSTEDATKILAAAGIRLPAPEEVGDAGVVSWLSWMDPFQNYSEDEIVNTGYYTFTDFYGGSLDYRQVLYEDMNDTLATMVVSDSSPDMTLAGTSNTATFPLNCLKGMYQTVDQYIDYTDPLWSDMADAAEYFALGDKHFGIVYDIVFKDIIPYNKRVISDYGYEDPYELFCNNEWTWDKFADMCMDFSDPDSDRYALDGWYYVIGLAEESTGRYLIEKDSEGNYYSNIDDPYIEVAMNLIYDLYKNECCYHEGTNYWARRGGVSGTGVKDGLCLFCPINVEAAFMQPVDEVATLWGDMTSQECMFVPFPRYENGDGEYYINSQPTGYMLCKGAPNPKGAVLLASCMRFKVVDPTVVDIDEKQLRETYLWNDDMLDMFKTCEELAQKNVRMFYTGNLPENLQDVYDHLDWGINRTGGANTWAQLKEQYGEQMSYYIDQMNSDLKKYIETGESLYEIDEDV